MRRRRDNVLPFRKPSRTARLRQVRNRPHRRKGKWRSAFAGVWPWLLLIALATAFLFMRQTGWDDPDFDDAQDISLTFPFCSAPGYSPNCVVDGDTIHIGDRRIRLTGFDAPEIDGECAAESDAAQRAKTELARWLAAGPFQLDGGDDPPRDQYGRELRAARRISASGQLQLLSDHMIGAELAEGDYYGAGWSNDWGIGRGGWC